MFFCVSLHIIHRNRCSDSLLSIAVELRIHSIFVECIRIQKPLSLVLFCHALRFFSLSLLSPLRPLKRSKMYFILKPASTHHNIEYIWSRVFRCTRYSVSHKTKLNAALILRAVFFLVHLFYLSFAIGMGFWHARDSPATVIPIMCSFTEQKWFNLILYFVLFAIGSSRTLLQFVRSPSLFSSHFWLWTKTH